MSAQHGFGAGRGVGGSCRGGSPLIKYVSASTRGGAVLVKMKDDLVNKLFYAGSGGEGGEALLTGGGG